MRGAVITDNVLVVQDERCDVVQAGDCLLKLLTRAKLVELLQLSKSGAADTRVVIVRAASDRNRIDRCAIIISDGVGVSILGSLLHLGCRRAAAGVVSTVEVLLASFQDVVDTDNDLAVLKLLLRDEKVVIL